MKYFIYNFPNLSFFSDPKSSAPPGGSDGKDSPHNAGDLGLIPGDGNNYHSGILSMDRGTWWATVHAVAKSQA